MLQTGVPNLDLLLGGGIPEGNVLLVVGPAGAGKSTLALQMAFHTAAQGQNVLYVATVSEPSVRLIRHVRAFSFYDERLIGEHLFLLDIYPLIKQDLSHVLDALTQAVREHRAVLVVLDGLATIHDLHPEVPELRAFIYELGAALPALGCTTVLTSSWIFEPTERPLPEYTMADGTVELGMQQLGTQTRRTIRVVKMRGLAPLLGLHSARIDRAGLTAFPRLESVFELRDASMSVERMPLGLPELDAMMHGGLPVDSTTLVAGALGTGKTLACLQFVMEGVRRGERALFVGFRETPRQLMDRAHTFGLDLAAAVAAGQVAILHYLPVDLSVDAATWETLEAIQRFAPQRLALDSVADLEYAFSDERRRRGYMSAFAQLLRQQGVTALITKEIAQVVGPELDFSDTPLAMLAENLVLLRYVEFRGEIYRILSILKMRDTDHDRSIRQYTIGEKGLQVRARFETAEGLLTGIARLPSELRVKRRTTGPEGGGMAT